MEVDHTPSVLGPADLLSLTMTAWSQMSVCTILAVAGNDDTRWFGYVSCAMTLLWLPIIVHQWNSVSGVIVGFLEMVRESFDSAAPKGIAQGVSSKSKLKRRIRGLDTAIIEHLSDLAEAEKVALKAKTLLCRAFVTFAVQFTLMAIGCGVMTVLRNGLGQGLALFFLLAGVCIRVFSLYEGTLDNAWSECRKARKFVPLSEIGQAKGPTDVPPEGRSYVAEPGFYAGIWWVTTTLGVLLALVPGTGVFSGILGLIGLGSMTLAIISLNRRLKDCGYPSSDYVNTTTPTTCQRVEPLRGKVVRLTMETALTTIPLYGLAWMDTGIPYGVMVCLALLTLPSLYVYARELPIPVAMRHLRESSGSR